MIKIGQYNDLTVSRTSDYGIYLTDTTDPLHAEVLLPAKFVTTDMLSPDATVRVFVYTDSEDRPVATTRHPLAEAWQIACLQVVDVTDVGAFLDWGLEKDLLVPFREQKMRMRKGMQYIVYVYVDDVTGRVAATAKYERFIDNTIPEYGRFERVTAFIVAHTDLGYRAVVNNLHSGMLYENELHRALEIGESVTAYVRKVRDDGKLDLTLLAPAAERTQTLADAIVSRLERSGGTLDIGDSTSPEYISASFGCSKKDFKKALGMLLRERRIVKTDNGGIGLV